MNNCCKETFKNALNEVLLTIKKQNVMYISDVIRFLEISIEMLEDAEKAKTNGQV